MLRDGGLEVHVPQPAEVLAVDQGVADRDQQVAGQVLGGQRAQGGVVRGRVLGEAQHDLSFAGRDPLQAAEGRPHAGQRGRRAIERDAEAHGQRDGGRRVIGDVEARLRDRELLLAAPPSGP